MTRLPRDPVIADAWQQFATHALCQPQVGWVALLALALLLGLPILAVNL